MVENELDVEATKAVCTDAELTVELEDGRTISAPLAWYPRLKHATPRERQNVQIEGFGLHWPDLDEDISIRGLLLGRRSQESRESLSFWLESRKKGRKVTFQDFMKQRRKSATRKVAKK